MAQIRTERIHLQNIPMRQRKRIGMFCQRYLSNPRRTVEGLRTQLQVYADTHSDADTIAVRWMLARLTSDPLFELNSRQYICELMYG